MQPDSHLAGGLSQQVLMYASEKLSMWCKRCSAHVKFDHKIFYYVASVPFHDYCFGLVLFGVWGVGFLCLIGFFVVLFFWWVVFCLVFFWVFF